ncbi:unnamed protein product [Rhizophagus irregularis]|nr:unnamed protein product [Rhizophagus irregularis]
MEFCLPPSPNEINRYEKWHDNEDEDYFSFAASNLATSNKARSKHSTQAFARLETTKENDTFYKKNSTFTSKPPMQKHLTKDFDSYVSEFIRHSGFTMKVAKRRETTSIFGNFF